MVVYVVVTLVMVVLVMDIVVAMVVFVLVTREIALVMVTVHVTEAYVVVIPEIVLATDIVVVMEAYVPAIVVIAVVMEFVHAMVAYVVVTVETVVDIVQLLVVVMEVLQVEQPVLGTARLIILNKFMEILRYQNASHMVVLGEPPIWDGEYVMAKHCLVVDVDKGKLILNALSRSIVYLDNNELSNLGDMDTYGYLYKTYFLVPEDFDSMKAIDKIRENLKVPIDKLYLKHPNEFTILSTTACNARCFYCYENNSKKKHHMTNETALEVAKYIVKVCPGQASLHWFGGEPLFNAKSINIITDYLRAKNIQYDSSMTTNGYLFSEELIEKAINQWHLNACQITLDGTEQVYNKTKNYIYKDSNSPYKRVIRNIEMLLNRNIHVNVRLNIDLYNLEDIKKLIGELFSNFGLHPELTIYVWPIFDEDNTRSDEENTLLFKGVREIEELIENYGYKQGDWPEETVKYSLCMADAGSSVTISPDGDLGTCEHLIDKDFIGHISNSEYNYDILNTWRDYKEPLDICKDCPLYGSCIRPVNCLEMSKCSEHIKEWKIRKAVYGLLSFYNDYLINKQNERNQTIQS